ncbi:MAG: hypothetical protein EON57_15715, partial [Alphaproteobacteria bacterium]
KESVSGTSARPNLAEIIVTALTKSSQGVQAALKKLPTGTKDAFTPRQQSGFAHLRRDAFGRQRAENVLTHGLLKLDREAYQVRAAGSPVPMRPNEFLLLAYFLEHRDRVVSRRELIGALKGEETVDQRTVDVWIGRLRRALIAAKVSDPIRTVRQLGYVYDSF